MVEVHLIKLESKYAKSRHIVKVSEILERKQSLGARFEGEAFLKIAFLPAFCSWGDTNRLNCKYPGESHTIYCNDITVNCMGLSRILTVQAICVPSCTGGRFLLCYIEGTNTRDTAATMLCWTARSGCYYALLNREIRLLPCSVELHTGML